MTTQDIEGSDLVRPGRRGYRWPIALALLTLVVGLAAGYLLRTVTEPEPVVPPVPAAPVAAPPPPPGPDLSPCTEVADRGADLVAQLDRAARAIGALDPTMLRDVLDEVRVVRDDLRSRVDTCRQRLAEPGTSGG